MEKTEKDIRKLTGLGKQDALIKVNRPHFERLKREVLTFTERSRGGFGYVMSEPEVKADYFIVDALGKKNLIYTLEPEAVEVNDEITIQSIIDKARECAEEELYLLIVAYGEQQYEKGSSAQFYGAQ